MGKKGKAPSALGRSLANSRNPARTNSKVFINYYLFLNGLNWTLFNEKNKNVETYNWIRWWS